MIKSTFAVAGLAMLLGFSWASSESPEAQGVQGVTSSVTVVNTVAQRIPVSLPESPLQVTASAPLPVTANTDLPVLVNGTTLTRDVDNPALNHYRSYGDLILEKDLQNINEQIVPPVALGKRLVIEHIAIRGQGQFLSGVDVEATIRVPDLRNPEHGRVPIELTNRTLTRRNGQDLHFLTGSEDVTLYVDANETVELEIIFGPEPLGGGRLYWTLIGRALDI